MYANSDESNSRDTTVKEGLENTISKDSFLTYFVPFWQVIRKEDLIVERIVWALTEQKNCRIDFVAFHLFYKLFIYQEWYIIQEVLKSHT